MSTKRTLPLLLILTALLGLFASSCCFDPYYRRSPHHRGGHHRRASLEPTIAAPRPPAAEAPAR